MAAGAFTDSAGNTSVATSKAGLTIDNTAPTVTIGNPSKTVIKSGGTATYTITLSETATLDSSKITVTGAGSTGSKVEVTGSGRSYTATVTGGTGNGAVTLKVAARSVLHTVAGNTSVATSKAGLAIDNTAPTVTIGNPSKTVIKSGGTATSTGYLVTWNGNIQTAVK